MDKTTREPLDAFHEKLVSDFNFHFDGTLLRANLHIGPSTFLSIGQENVSNEIGNEE
jgi:hypothetical protein